MKIKFILFALLLISFQNPLKAQQNQIRFGISIDSVFCKYVTITDSTPGTGEKRIEMGDGNFFDNNYDIQANFPFVHYFINKVYYRYKQNGTFTITYTHKYFDSSAMSMRVDTLRKNVTIQCDSCSLKANFNFKFTTVDPSLAYLGSLHLGSPYINRWTLGDGDSSSLDTFIHKYKTAGTYRITLVTSLYDSSLQQYCTDTVRLRISISSSGISYRNISENLKVYPNPFINKLEFENHSELQESITVYDMNGKPVDKFVLEAKSVLSAEAIDWSPGLYLLVFSDGSTLKILKE